MNDNSTKLEGLKNDAYYWELRRTYGDDSPEVRKHLAVCAIIQACNKNHT